MEKVEFTLKNKDTNCVVYSGRNLKKEIINYLKQLNAPKYVIVTDSKVKTIHGNNFLQKIRDSGLDCEIVAFPEGEKNKTRETKAMIEDFMFEKGLGRDCIVIALGGGVVGDMTGFVAGTYMRGVPVVQIPTTTISIADSSYGGKTGLDVPSGKNLIGLFHQPITVFMDSDLLKTLDERNYKSGLIEVVKHGMIKDENFYEFLKENIGLILLREGEKYEKTMEKLMIDNIQIKRNVVVEDQKESNLRKILNYGHTVGHAVEKLSNFELLHGEAIAIGICVEAFIAYKKNISSKETYLEQKEFIEKMCLETNIPPNISTDKIIELMHLDKKSREGKSEFTLIKEIGKHAVFDNGKVTISFEDSELKEIIEKYRKQEM